MNVALKVAIVETQKTSRQVSLRARIPEQRLSQIIHNKVIATDQERQALAKALGRDIADLFPMAVAS